MVGKDLKTNLIHQSGNGVLESLGGGGEGMKIVSLVGIHNTLGTDSSLISLAVGVDLKMRMLLTVKNPGSRLRGSSLEGLVSGDEHVMGRDLLLLVDPLASITLELVTLLALDGGLVLLAQLTPDIIRINLGTGIGSRHHPSSEIVGGEILNSL